MVSSYGSDRWRMAAMAVVGIATPALANVPLTRVSKDPFTNATSQHRTEVEPDTFAFGSTIVSAFQVGRVFGGGSSNIGWATSTNGGATWTNGFLPGITSSNAGGPVRSRQRPGGRLRRPARRLDDLLARRSTAPTGAGARGQPLHQRRADLEQPGRHTATGGQTRQELDRLRQHHHEPLLRQLLHRLDDIANGNRILHANLHRRRPDLGRGARHRRQRHRPRRPAGGAAQRHRHRARRATPSRPRSRSAPSTAAPAGGPPCWSPASATTPWPAACGPARCPRPRSIGRHRLCGVAGLPVPLRLHVQRHRDEQVDQRNHLGPVTRVPIDATSSTVDHFIPGIGVDRPPRRPPPGSALTYYFYPSSQLRQNRTTASWTSASSPPPTAAPAGARPTQVAGPMTLSWMANTSRAAWSATTSPPPGGGRAWPTIAVAGAPSGRVRRGHAVPTGGLGPRLGRVREHVER